MVQTGKQVQPDELGPRHKGDRRGSLSKNLERVFGKTAVNALKGVEETKKNTGFECVRATPLLQVSQPCV